MDYIQFSTLLATMLGGFGFIYKEMKTIETDMKDEGRTQAKRSDDLYRMFIDLVKEGRQAK